MPVALFWMIVSLAGFVLLNRVWLRLYLRVQMKQAVDGPAWFPTREAEPRPKRSRGELAGVQAPSRRSHVIAIDAPRRRQPRRQNIV